MKTFLLPILSVILSGCVPIMIPVDITGGRAGNSAAKSPSPAVRSYALPQPSYDYKYDPATGNSYHISKDGHGNTYVQGSNLSTGRRWDTSIDKSAVRLVMILK